MEYERKKSKEEERKKEGKKERKKERKEQEQNRTERFDWIVAMKWFSDWIGLEISRLISLISPVSER